MCYNKSVYFLLFYHFVQLFLLLYVVLSARGETGKRWQICILRGEHPCKKRKSCQKIAYFG